MPFETIILDFPISPMRCRNRGPLVYRLSLGTPRCRTNQILGAGWRSRRLLGIVMARQREFSGSEGRGRSIRIRNRENVEAARTVEVKRKRDRRPCGSKEVK